MLTNVFLLLILFQAKHFLADYPLQTPFRFMLGKFLPGWKFVPPLLAHVAVHAALTASIAIGFGCSAALVLKLALFDAAAHFVMDRLKASPRYLGRWKALSANEWMQAQGELSCVEEGEKMSHAESARRALLGNILFWNALGLDQMVHHLTHYACAWWILKATGGL